MGALDVQVGGSHYKSGAIQPIEFAEANSMIGADPSILKYILRHKKKGGAEDIKKVIHYFEILLDTIYNPEWKYFRARMQVVESLIIPVEDLFDCYELNVQEECVLKWLISHRFQHSTAGAMMCEGAASVARKLLKEEYGDES